MQTEIKDQISAQVQEYLPYHRSEHNNVVYQQSANVKHFF